MFLRNNYMIGTRIRSAFIDMMSIIIVAGILMAPVVILKSESLDILATTLLWTFIINKDCWNGRSFGKLNTGLCVVSDGGIKASALKCLLRNLVLLLWPIEIVFLALDKKRRLGDYIAGTKVVEFGTVRDQSDFSKLEIFLTLILTFSVLYYIVKLTVSLDYL